MGGNLVVWSAMTLCWLLSSACLSDLKPDVGALKPTTSESTVGNGMNGAGNGSSTASNNSGTNQNDSGGNGPGDNGDTNGANAGSTAGDGGSQGGDDAAVPPDAGDPIPDNGCDIKDSNPKRDVTFAGDIWPILSGCSCHDPNSADPAGVLEVGLVIDSYKALRMGGDNTHENIIVAGDACKSIILQKLGEATPPFGVRMPRDGPYLSPEVRMLISDWIVEGARDN